MCWASRLPLGLPATLKPCAAGAKKRRRPRPGVWRSSSGKAIPPSVEPPLLPALSTWRPDAIRNLALQAFGEPGFCARPLWQGSPAESSVLSRLGDDPTLSACIGTMGSRSAARLLARLPSRLLDGGPAVVRAWTLDAGTGVAGVETSRGLLLHFVRLKVGRVSEYRILAPTEWNFHPVGPLAETLAELPADARLTQRARRAVASLDPCVTGQVEIRHA